MEAFEEYITPIHRFVYNNVYVDDVRKIIDNLELTYELVLLIDVLEHFDKEKGALLVRKILTGNGGIIISTPKKFINQINAFANEYEMHRSQWKQAELSLFGSSLFLKDDVYVPSSAESKRYCSPSMIFSYFYLIFKTTDTIHTSNILNNRSSMSSDCRDIR